MTVRPEVTGQKPLETTEKLARVSSDLLRGAKAIALELYGDDSRAAQRRLYHERDHWPIFQLEDDGVFYALRSRLRAHVESKSAEQEAKIIAAANTAETKTVKPHRAARLRRAQERAARVPASNPNDEPVNRPSRAGRLASSVPVSPPSEKGTQR